LAHHSTDREPGVRPASRFSARSGSDNLDCRSNHPDVLRDGEGPSRRPEQTKEHVMMVGSWGCRVSSEIHIGGRRVSEPVHDDKGKEKVAEPGDEKDPKRARVVLSKGHEVVGPGYSRLLGAATEVMHKGENSGNPNQVNRVSKTEQCYPSRVNWTDRVSQIGRDSRSDQRIDWVSRVANTERWAVENSASTGSQVTQGLGDKKSEEGKSAASSRRPAPRWCLRGITKTQKRWLQKLR
jgi:hypothetical protein